jgi:hypothetical protein
MKGTFHMKHLDTLKKKMTVNDNFKETFEFYFDHFAENPDFMQKGQPVENEKLMQAAKTIAKQILGEKKITLTNFMLMGLPDFHFYHGVGFVNQSLINIFYFEDIDTGMAAIAAFPPGSSETKISRFTCSERGAMMKPSVN